MNQISLNRPRQERLAQELGQLEATKKTIQQAFVDAGYSEKTGAGGWTKVPPRTLKLLAKQGSKLARIGAELSIEDCKHLVIGRLAQNCVKGKDGGVMSAKTLGSRKELNLWVADSQVGVVIVGASPVQPKTIDAPADLEPE